MAEPLISVIVPVYNVEMYISACLDSIINQSYRNLEIIVINDGSTDLSLQIAEKYSEKDDRVKVYSFANEGLSEARNRGLSVATGEYITFIDSDDQFFPGALKIFYSVLIKENADIVQGRTIKGKVYETALKPKHLKIKKFTNKEAISDVLYQNILLPSLCGKIFRRELFDGIRFEKGILYEDLNIFYLIFEKCKRIVWIDWPVYFYRNHDLSITHTWKTKRLDVLQVTKNIENYISEKYPDLLPSAQDRRLSANFNMFALCSIHNERDSALECWNYIKENRNKSLLNTKVRIKNKAGIILSYFGRHIFNFAARRVYK